MDLRETVYPPRRFAPIIQSNEMLKPTEMHMRAFSSRKEPGDSQNGSIASPVSRSRRSLHALLPVFLLLSVLAGTPGTARAQDIKPAPSSPTLGLQVNDAIKRAVAALKARQKADGNFEGGPSGTYPDGVTALCLLALLKSGVPASDPVVRKALSALRYAPYRRTYSTAVRILVYEALKNEEYEKAMHVAADWLTAQFREGEGAWGYPDAAVDLSNTQYAVLGLWAAERHGFRTPRRLWIRLAQRVQQHQRKDGGFAYHPGDAPTGSMTTAGLTVLAIAKDHLPAGHQNLRNIQAAMDRGWAWLDQRFRPDGNPQGKRIYTRIWYHYFLYGLERACAVCDRDKVGGRDWYREGAAALLALQLDNGTWGDTVETSFALLFLRLSTYTTMHRKHGTNLNGVASASPKKTRPLPWIPFVRHWLVLGPFPDPEETALFEERIREKKAAPRSGQGQGGNRWTAGRSIKPFFDLQALFPKTLRSAAYAFTFLHVEKGGPAVIWFGSDDGARILLDGKEIHFFPFRIHEPPDTHRIPVTLTPGVHRLLLKITQFDGKWGFYLRITKPDGTPLPGLVPGLEPGGPTGRERVDAQGPFLSLAELFRLLPLDRKTRLEFDTRKELDRVAVIQCGDEPPFEWCADTRDITGPGPGPGPKGVICVHPVDTKHPVRIVRKIRAPSKRARVLARLSAYAPRVCEQADWIVRIRVFDGAEERVLLKEVISASDGWKEVSAPLGVTGGREVLVVLECACGGPGGDWFYEQAYIDSFSIRNF